MQKHLPKLSILLALIYLSNSAMAQANFVWAKQMGGTGNENGNSIALDASGNVYTTGHFSGTADFDPGAGTYTLTSAGLNDIFISKLDAAGNFIWAKALSGLSGSEGYSIVLDPSGNIYTTGFFNGTYDFDPGPGTFTLTSSGNGDIFICKLDAAGSFIWAKQMGGIGSVAYGQSVVLDVAGNVYTTGFFYGTTDFDPGAGTFTLTSVGANDIFISKLDAAGNFIWAKQMGGTGFDVGNSIAMDAVGNVYTSGYFKGTADFDPGAGSFTLTSAGITDIFISKLDAAGNFIWAKQMGGTFNEIGNFIAIDAFGNVYTTGNFQSTVDFDPGAGTFTLTSIGYNDIFISKLDAAGNFIWAKAIGGTGTNEGYSIALDASGNVYTTGYFEGAADFDPGAGTSTLTSVGLKDIFISKLNSAGNFVWAKQMGGAGDDVGFSIALNTASNIYTTGYFNGTADFDPGVGIFNLTSAGNADVFVHKMFDASVGIYELEFGDFEIKVFPNPNHGSFQLQLDASTGSAQVAWVGSAQVASTEINKGELVIYNCLGQKVYEQTVIQGINEIKTTGLANGLYQIILLSDKQKIKSGKLVVE